MSKFTLFQKALAERLDPAVRKPLAEYADALRADLRAMNPADLAQRAGAVWHPASAGGGELHLALWGDPVLATFPELVFRPPEGRPLDDLSQALLLHFLQYTDGTATAGQWIAFSELPDARFYAVAFQGYTGRPLTQKFGQDADAFARAADRAGGFPVAFADRAFVFQPLARSPLLVACWQGDEDFPASYRILFDAAAPHHLDTEACAIVGSMLTRRLLRWADK